jgi:hypothetical protein
MKRKKKKKRKKGRKIAGRRADTYSRKGKSLLGGVIAAAVSSEGKSRVK